MDFKWNVDEIARNSNKSFKNRVLELKVTFPNAMQFRFVLRLQCSWHQNVMKIDNRSAALISIRVIIVLTPYQKSRPRFHYSVQVASGQINDCIRQSIWYYPSAQIMYIELHMSKWSVKMIYKLDHTETSMRICQIPLGAQKKENFLSKICRCQPSFRHCRK